MPHEDGAWVWVDDPHPHVRTGGNACLLRVIAVPLVLFGGLVALGTASQGRVDDITFFSLMAMLFGVVAWAGANNQKRMDLRSHLRVDPEARTLSVYKTSRERALVFPLSEVRRLVVSRQTQADQPGDGPPDWEWCVAAQLEDEAELWLFADAHAGRFESELMALYEVLGVPIHDTVDRGWSRPVLRAWEPVEVVAPEPSRFLHRLTTTAGAAWSLKTEETWSSRIIVAGTWAIFFGIPLWIFGQTLVAVLSDFSFWLLIPLVVVGAFVAAFLALAFFMLATLLRDYRVVVEGEWVLVELRFRMKLLQDQLGKEILIPLEEVRHVRAHRRRDGSVVLDLVHEGTARVREAREWFRIGAFLAPTGATTCRELWTFAAGTREGTGADFGDAAHLLHALRAALDLPSGQ